MALGGRGRLLSSILLSYLLFIAAKLSDLPNLANLAELTTENSERIKELWNNFKSRNHKIYDSLDEENTRFRIFAKNLKLVSKRNQLDGAAAVHGMTQFLDLSHKEFYRMYLRFMNKDTHIEFKGKVYKPPSDLEIQYGKLVNWTSVLTSPVKEQKSCGGCWAFAAAQQMESDAIRLLNKRFHLSPGQLLECDTLQYGCDGGKIEGGYKYAHEHGMMKEASYPFHPHENDYSYYVPVDGSECRFDERKTVLKLVDYYSIKSEEDLTKYVQSTGPVAVCIDASHFNTYNGGILKHCSTEPNHCVQAVGVLPSKVPGEGYWIIRNSWTSSWGEHGFVRIPYGVNACGISVTATFTTVKLIEHHLRHSHTTTSSLLDASS